MEALLYIVGRLKEPSTWAGLAVFIGMFGLSPDTVDRVTQNAPAIATAIAAVIAILAPSVKKVNVVHAAEGSTVEVTGTTTVSPDATGVTTITSEDVKANP